MTIPAGTFSSVNVGDRGLIQQASSLPVQSGMLSTRSKMDELCQLLNKVPKIKCLPLRVLLMMDAKASVGHHFSRWTGRVHLAPSE